MKVNGIEYAGQHNTGLTFLLDANVAVGDAVTMTAAGTAARGAADAALLGRAETKEVDLAGTVFTRGVVVVRWTGSAVFGLQKVGVDGAGAAKVSATGKEVLVIGVSAGLAAIDLG
jgi:hypothetical protein